MSRDKTLTVVSLLCVLLFSIHVSDDIVRGFEPGDLKHLGTMSMLFTWTLATLVWMGRRLGYVLILLGSLLMCLFPYAHLRGAGVGGALAASPGGHFFIWTLLVIGALAPMCAVLASLGLWNTRKSGRSAAARASTN